MQISLSKESEIQEIFSLVQACASHMTEKGINQWDENYPTIDHLQKDIKTDSMYSLHQEGVLIGIMVMDENQSPQYEMAKWKYIDPPHLVVHRLAIHPNQQGKGLGKVFMKYAEDHALKSDYRSIRLDTFTENPGTMYFYTNLGYEQVGEIPLEYTKGPFMCFEKKI